MKLNTVISLLEGIVKRAGQAVSWLTVIMVLVMFTSVALRYWFDTSWIWLQESVTWMHAAVFMLAAAFTLAEEEHVRVDIFYRRLSPKQQALINAVGTLIFLLPFAGFLTWVSWRYVELSWAIRETSSESGGLPYPWIPLMKSFIPATALLLVLQGLAMLLRSVLTIVKPEAAD